MTEALHHDKDKLGLQWILSMSGIEDVAKVGDYGAKKYTQGNWRGGSSWMRFAGSCARHLFRYISGELLDNESGLPHLAHCAYDCLILLTWAREGKGTDDRPQASRYISNPQTNQWSPLDCRLSSLYNHDSYVHPSDDTDQNCEIIE